MHLRILFAIILACSWNASLRANPALDGYLDEAALQEKLNKLDQSALVSVRSLGKTIEGRSIPLITLGTGEVDKKPALLIIAHVQPSHVLGTDVVIRMVEKLLAQQGEEAVKKLLDERTIYILPQPSPDAAAKCYLKPLREPQGNARKTDDDRDGEQGEDPPEDLNGDGWITMMRITDPAGEYFAHPDDPRVLIKAEPAKNERGVYRLLVEGRDNDGDEKWNEDAADGVNFNRNFTFNYPAFKPAAGVNQVSEAETRAIADFCFDHPNIALVWSMTPEDNLLQPWKVDGNKDKARIRTTIQSGDVTYQDYVAGLYQKLKEPKGVPGSPAGEGSFSEWAYYHYGRWSYATRLWWVPPVEAKPVEGEKKSDEKRGADDLNALRYFADKKIDGFVDWTPIEHPDFPGQKVEVGGFKPFYRLNPLAAELDEIASRQFDFLLQLVKLQPHLTLSKLKAESLGGGVVRLTAVVQNEGYLPTMAEMGDVNNQAYPLQLTWQVPEKSQWLQGSPRSRIGRLVGQGGRVERVWLVRLPEPLPKELKINVQAPAVGSVDAMVPVSP